MEWILDQWTQCMLCNVTVLEVAFGMNIHSTHTLRLKLVYHTLIYGLDLNSSVILQIL